MSDTTIEIRIRHELEPTADARPAFRWPVDRLDELPRLIARWGGLYDEVNGDTWDDAAGQFIVTESGVHFELILSGGDDA
jgi:hypothetical protein